MGEGADFEAKGSIVDSSEGERGAEFKRASK